MQITTLAAARAILLDPDASRVLHHIAWCFLKSARGQNVRQSVLNRLREGAA